MPSNNLSTFVQAVGSDNIYSPLQNARFYVTFEWEGWAFNTNKKTDPSGNISIDNWTLAPVIGTTTNDIGITSYTSKDNNCFADTRNIKKMINNFDFYVREFQLPNIKIGARALSLDSLHEDEPGYAKVILQQSLLVPQEQSFGITFIDTEESIIDNFIEPWARSVVSPRGMLNKNNPKISTRYPTAKICIYVFSKNSDISSEKKNNAIRQYTLTKCFPSIIDSPTYTHQNSDYVERRVEFAFDKIWTKKLPGIKKDNKTKTSAESTNVDSRYAERIAMNS